MHRVGRIASGAAACCTDSAKWSRTRLRASAAAAFVVTWAIVGVAVDFPEWWKTALYSVTGSATFLMVFVIQHTQHATDRSDPAQAGRADPCIRQGRRWPDRGRGSPCGALAGAHRVHSRRAGLDVMSAFDWLFRNRQTGTVTIAQFPNLPLWITIAAAVVQRLAVDGSVLEDGRGPHGRRCPRVVGHRRGCAGREPVATHPGRSRRGVRRPSPNPLALATAQHRGPPPAAVFWVTAQTGVPSVPVSPEAEGEGGGDRWCAVKSPSRVAL